MVNWPPPNPAIWLDRIALAIGRRGPDIARLREHLCRRPPWHPSLWLSPCTRLGSSYSSALPDCREVIPYAPSCTRSPLNPAIGRLTQFCHSGSRGHLWKKDGEDKIYDNVPELRKGKLTMWSADIFDDSDPTRPSRSRSFRTYEELRNWLVTLIAENPGKDFCVSFQVPADATEAQLKHLRILGPTNFIRN
jgi:hypothetical protein